MTDMRLDRIHGPAALAVGVIDAHAPEKRIRRISKHLQVARVSHVSVIVDPFRAYLHRGEPQRSVRVTGGRFCRGVVETLLYGSQRSSSADVVFPKHLLNVDQV